MSDWMQTAVVAATLAVSSLAASSASASPWVLPEDTGVLSGRFDFQSADREFLGSGEVQAFPLNGTYRTAAFITTLRYGLLDGVELELDVPLQIKSYLADPVILSAGDDGAGIDYYQENVLNFSQTVAGVGDIRLAGRYQLLDSELVSALEVKLKVPTGYQRPAGTFGREPKSKEAFRQNSSSLVRPENVQDDVTLGDGQVDLTGLALLGWTAPTATFVRFDGGYKLRMRGGGDQLVGLLKIGQLIGKRVLLQIGSKIEYAVQDGEVIGISVAAEDPSLPAEEFAGTKNLKLRRVRLDYDRLAAKGGVIFRISDRVESQLNYSRVLWGRNISLTQTVSLGIGVKFDASDQS